MVDISARLSQEMTKNNCSAMRAFLLVTDGVYILQSKSQRAVRRGLCDKSNIQSNKSIVGKDIY